MKYKIEIGEEATRQIMEMKTGENRVIDGMRVRIEKIRPEEAWSQI